MILATCQVIIETLLEFKPEHVCYRSVTIPLVLKHCQRHPCCLSRYQKKKDFLKKLMKNKLILTHSRML